MIQLSTVQKEYQRLQMMHKNNPEKQSINEAYTELTHLRELNKVFFLNKSILYYFL